MTLLDIFSKISEFDPDLTIWVQGPQSEWSESCRAEVALEPEDGGTPEGLETYSYFLEVQIVQELAKALQANYTNQQLARRVIGYAINDA